MTAQSSHSDRTNKTSNRTDDIASFIRSSAFSDGTSAAEKTEFLLIALSVKSPVIAALKQALSDFDGDRIPTRVVLASLPENDPAEELAALAPAEIRWAQNPRLLDAHEQLVIGANASWTGDCMRRDPNKRDAYHSFNADCPEATGWAHISFERLWQASKPLASLAAGGVISKDASPDAAQLALRASISDVNAEWVAAYRQSR